ncbi:hypothetical protein AX15_006914 [Amanita polypyramis BW_CC]|nr:hypothetical protein AX15_006914 [Amanita polypyramis BW_CC]
MRLSTIPQLPKHLTAALEQCGIRTDTDLLFSKTPLEVFSGLPEGIISLNDLIQHIEAVAEAASAPGTTAIETLLQAEQEMTVRIGVPIFDELISESSQHGVIEISGPRGSGKSSLALNIALRYLVKHIHASAIWFDTTGDFAPERGSLILESLTVQDITATLDRLQVCQSFDIDSVLNVLDVATDADPSWLRFVVVDTVTQLLGPNLSAVSAQGHSIMVHFMRYLREKSRFNQLTTIVLNNSIHVIPGSRNLIFNATDQQPALGPSFAFLTDSTLWLSKPDSDAEEDASKLTVEVLRSKTLPSRTWETFTLHDGVIYEAD